MTMMMTCTEYIALLLRQLWPPSVTRWKKSGRTVAATTVPSIRRVTDRKFRRLHGSDVTKKRNRHADERRLVLVVQCTSVSGAERSVDVVAVAAATRRRRGQVGGRGPATDPAAPGPPTQPRVPAVGGRRPAVGYDARRRQRDGNHGRQTRRHDDPVQPHRLRDGNSLRSEVLGGTGRRRTQPEVVFGRRHRRRPEIGVIRGCGGDVKRASYVVADRDRPAVVPRDQWRHGGWRQQSSK